MLKESESPFTVLECRLSCGTLFGFTFYSRSGPLPALQFMKGSSKELLDLIAFSYSQGYF